MRSGDTSSFVGVGPKLHIGKALLAYVVAGLILTLIIVVRHTVQSLQWYGEISYINNFWLAALLAFPASGTLPVLAGVIAHALIGRRLQRRQLLFLLVALCASIGLLHVLVVSTMMEMPEGASIELALPISMVPGALWAILYVWLLPRPTPVTA